VGEIHPSAEGTTGWARIDATGEDGRMSTPETSPWWAGLRRQTAFHASGLVVATGAFLTVLPLLVLGLATAVVWLGLPVLVTAASVATWWADVERVHGAGVAQQPERPPYLSSTSRLGPLADPQRWRDVVHAIVGFPVRVAAAAVALGWLVIALGTALFVLWEWALPRGDVSGLYGLVTGRDSRLAEIVVNTALGLVGLLLWPFVLRACTAARTGLARLLLVDESATLRAVAERAEDSRRAVVSAEEHTLNRVERDLHDGPQQRLVRLTMDLESARRRLGDDPEKVDGLLGEALEQSREALGELRALTRGIAPPILTERGLLAAVTAAAGRCPVETTVHTSLTPDRRFDPAVERAAYFLVAEALTNVAKHSGASRAEVTLELEGTLLTVRVEDDGGGGAASGKGHGLAGLADRVRSIGSRLDITSPEGGPTVLTAHFEAATSG
jgi:signal transduction histidine kinase